MWNEMVENTGIMVERLGVGDNVIAKAIVFATLSLCRMLSYRR